MFLQLRKFIAANWPKFLPFITVFFLLRLVRGEVHSWSYYLTAVICLGVYFGLKPRRAGQRVAVLAVGLVLFLAFLSKSYDLYEFLPIFLLHLAGVLVLWAWARLHAQSAWRMGLPVLIILIAGADLLHGHKVLKELWGFRPPSWLRGGVPAPETIFPYGTYLFEDQWQGYRYPELVARDFNLVGNRWRKCKDTRGNCNEEFEKFPYAIWTTFLFTKEFAKLFVTDGAMRSVAETVRNSFPQGTISQGAGAFTIRPECSFNGYLSLEPNGDQMIAQLALKEPRTIELPVLRARNLKEEIKGEALDSGAQSTLFRINGNSGLNQIAIQVGGPWKLAVLLFWLGPILWLIAFTSVGLTNLASREK